MKRKYIIPLLTTLLIPISVGSLHGDVTIRVDPDTLLIGTTEDTLNLSMDIFVNKVSSLQVDILFDTVCFVVTEVGKTRRTDNFDIFAWSEIENGIRFAITSHHSVDLGTGPVARIILDVSDECLENCYMWNIAECVCANDMGHEIPCIKEDTDICVKYKKGDVNGDGVVNILDVLAVVNHILNLQILQGDMLERADCNDDDQINILDVVGIVNIITGNFNDLYGTWVRTGYEENITILRKSEQLNEHEYGFIFCPDGKFVERKNAGWCGTPPITYANFEGEWIKLSESLLDIIVGYWGGTMSYKMEIVSLSSDELKILYHY